MRHKISTTNIVLLLLFIISSSLFISPALAIVIDNQDEEEFQIEEEIEEPIMQERIVYVEVPKKLEPISIDLKEVSTKSEAEQYVKFYTERKNTCHDIAEKFRSLGYLDSSEVIQLVREEYTESDKAFNYYNDELEKFIELEKLTQPDYSDADVMCITNMVYGEISAITYDNSYTKEEQDYVIQEWACVPLNHIKLGLADSIPELMCAKTSSGYYIWHPQYSTEYYMNKALNTNPDLYNRCKENVLIVLDDQMVNRLPDNVIYADLAVHGSGVYKMYPIDTGYYRSTVYLSYK